MLQGTVISFNDINGTGKIMGDDGVIVKVSQRSLPNDGYKILDESQRVKFQIMKNKSGLEARDVIPND